MMKTSIWVDCDTASQHPELDLIGVSTVHGNAPVELNTHNTCAVLEAFGSSSVPVIRGSDRPLTRKATFAPEYHGSDGLGGVTLLPTSLSYDTNNLPTGIDQIYNRLIGQPKESVWFVATGPLTNLAKLLSEYPDVVSVIKGVSIMGGAIGDSFTNAPMHRAEGPGNWTPWAEFNIFCDPEAARIVLHHEILSKRTVLIPLDLTHLCRGNKNVQKQLFHVHEPLSNVRAMMKQVLNFFAETYSRQSRGMSDGPPLHDPIAVYAVVAPTKFNDNNGERWQVDVTQDGNQAGRTVALLAASGAMGIKIPRAMDLAAFWADIDDCLSRAEQNSISK